MRRLILAVVGLGVVAATGGMPVAADEDAAACEWLAGDLHVHTYYSHDSWAGPGRDDPNTDPFEAPPGSLGDALTYGLSVAEERELATSRGLDYIAISDHDSIAAQHDPAYGTGDLIWVPDYENSVPSAGHAQMHGATRLYDDSVGPQGLQDALHAVGGAFQINHPSDMEWHDNQGNYMFPGFAPDALEIWNIGVWFYEPPFPATNDHEFAPKLYDEFLSQGFEIAATGGSDSHWRSTAALQGVGQPTTWVCSERPTWQGIVAGIRAGRTTISHQPPAYGGPFAYLEADLDDNAGNGFEAMLGETAPPGARLRAVVEGAPGAVLRVVTNGENPLPTRDVTGARYETVFDMPSDATWARAEVFYRDAVEVRRQLQPLCELSNRLFGNAPDRRNAYCSNRLAMVAMTSAIYFRDPDFDPATTIVYSGDRSGHVGQMAKFAATLTGSDGPIAGAPVTFEFRGEEHEATTDSDGHAATTVRMTGPPGTYEVITRFAGSDVYLPSQDSDSFVVVARP